MGLQRNPSSGEPFQRLEEPFNTSCLGVKTKRDWSRSRALAQRLRLAQRSWCKEAALLPGLDGQGKGPPGSDTQMFTASKDWHRCWGYRGHCCHTHQVLNVWQKRGQRAWAALVHLHTDYSILWTLPASQGRFRGMEHRSGDQEACQLTSRQAEWQ